MQKAIILIALVGCIVKVQAQQVSTCYKYTEKGEAIEPNVVWNVSSAGGNLYLLFNNNQKIRSGKLTVNIDKLKGNEYKGYEIKTLKADTTKTWAVLDYFFKEEGQYRITYLDSNYKPLAYTEIAIKVIQENATKTTANNNPEAFKRAAVVFSSKIDAKGLPSGVNNIFSIGKEGGAIKVKLTNPGPFNTDKFFVDTYKKNRRGEYELFESQNYPVLALNATWVYFTYVFKEAGEYKLAVYTKDNRYIVTGFITIIKTP